MPLYNYVCTTCGPFDAWSPMAHADSPCACPDCNRSSTRDVAAPHLSLMNGTLRKALTRSESSTSEPKRVKRAHLANCGCKMCGGSKKTSPMRRWMIGH
jgi:putative FmdB family regulatory protein